MYVSYHRIKWRGLGGSRKPGRITTSVSLPPWTRRSWTSSASATTRPWPSASSTTGCEAGTTGTTPANTLGCWLRGYKEQVFLFTRDFTVDWTKQRLRARRKSRQASPGRLRVLAHPHHPRPLVPHPQLPRLSSKPRPDRARRHQQRPGGQPLATRRFSRSLRIL
jgi:hypothetical protein